MVDVHSEELSNVISKSEGPSLDFKSAILLTNPVRKHRKKIAQNLVGFANRNGGKLVFGIDDETRQPEGEIIKEEDATETVSQIARDLCSPVVAFDHSYYDSTNCDLSEGSVFLVEIQKGGDIPHAYVNRTGAEIEKREYRFRAGDETRLVTDQELKILFNRGTLDTNISEKFSTFRVNTEEYIDAHPKNLRQPEGVRKSFRILQNMAPEDHDLLLDLPTKGNLHKTVAAYGFLLQFARRFSQSWLIELQQHPGQIAWEFDDSVEMDFLELDDVNNTLENTPFAETSHNPQDIMEQFIHDGFAVPAGTEISVNHSNIHSTIRIEKPNIFEFTIEFEYSSSGPGMPPGHPVIIQNPSQVESAEIMINFDAKFGYPDTRDPNYENHRQYAKTIVEILRDEWDAEHFYDQLPDQKLFEIDSKLDQLLDHQRSFLHPRLRQLIDDGQEGTQSEGSGSG